MGMTIPTTGACYDVDALVIASWAVFLVRTATAQGEYPGRGHPRQATDPAVGDRVAIRALGGAGRHRAIEIRRNELRSDAFRTKWLAANVDQLSIVIAADPRSRKRSCCASCWRRGRHPGGIFVNSRPDTGARADRAAHRAIGRSDTGCSTSAHATPLPRNCWH
jgi:hypothetical protein